MPSVNYCSCGVFCTHTKCRFNRNHFLIMDNKENSEHSLSPKEKMKMLVRLWKQKKQ
jgi:hypothetical protein